MKPSIKQVSKGPSLKLVILAKGSANIYPRLTPTMEWDTGATDTIDRESGKMAYRYDKKAQSNGSRPIMQYKQNQLNLWFVVEKI